MHSKGSSGWRVGVLAAVLLASCGGDTDEPVVTAQGHRRALSMPPAQAALARWSAPQALPLVPAAGAVLADGKLLLWAGDSPMSFGATGRTFTALFDPVSGQTSERLVSETRHEMFCPGTSMLADGRLLISGGSDAATTSLYDPVAGTWLRAADMNQARGYHASVTLGDGSVLAVGGSWSGPVGAKQAEVYTPEVGWRLLSGVSTATASLVTHDTAGMYRADNHMWLLPMANGRVLHAGPASTMHWISTEGNGSLEVAGPRADDSDSMSGNAVMFDAGRVLAVGGSVDYDGVVAKSGAFVIDTGSGRVQARRVSPMAYPRAFANSVVLPTGQVVVIGGQTFARPFSDDNAVLPAELFDPVSETFTVLPAMQVPRNYHSIALLLPDARVVSAGGGLCGGCAADHPDLQILSPPYLFNADGTPATRPQIVQAPATLAYGSTVTVNTDTPVASFAMVRLGVTTHTVNNDQRRIALAFVAGDANSYRLSVPSNPGILLPGPWMLFAINAAGTPSVARLLVVDNRTAPVLRNPGDQNLVPGQPVSIPLAASTPAGTLTYSATGLPAGLVIAPTSGVISGTPAGAGNQVVTVSVSNGSQTVSTDFLLTLSGVGQGAGTGLLAQYFNNLLLNGAPALQRVEVPDFDWGSAAPGAGVQADGFSVRWSGWLEPALTGATRIQTLSDEGVRVWVDNRLVIDNWVAHPVVATDAATVNLVAGRRVPVVVEYLDLSGPAVLRLQWQPPGAGAPVAIPTGRLFPSPVPGTQNLALGRPATQSSQYSYGSADKALDGLYDGIVTHTEALAANDWWQVDLGSLQHIDRVQLWNRMNCCSDRLSNFTLMVSATDPTGRSYEELLADPAVLKRQLGVTPILPTISIPVSAAGRYVRVQLAGTNFLSLAEVEVWGNPVAALAPTLNAVANQQTVVGTGVNLQPLAADPRGAALNFSATGLPPGLTLDAATGAIAGAPGSVGSYSVILTVTNASGYTADATFLWTVLDVLPQLTALPAPVAGSGVIGYAPVLGAGAAVQSSWNFGDGTPATPFTSGAAISHEFVNPGVYSVTLTLRSADGRSASYSLLQAIYGNGPRTPAQASGPLALEPRGTAAPRLWVVNGDNDSVSVFDTADPLRVAEVAVGTSPRSLARAADGRIWVVNQQSASISVINPATLALVQTVALPRASQPHGIVFSPVDGSAFVTLEATGELLKLDGATGARLGLLALGENPRHLAINGNGSQLLVSRFITRPLRDESTAAVKTTGLDGLPLGGEVWNVNPGTLALSATTVLAHGTRADAENQGRGVPNYLGAAAISPDGQSAWVPSKQDNVLRGGLRDGLPLNFQNTVRAVSSRINLLTGAEDTAGRIDHDNAGVASAAVYHPSGAYLFVALETSRQVAVVDAAGRRELFRFEVGRAPQGLVVSADGLKLYVSNFMDRSLSVIDLAPLIQQGRQGVATTLTRTTIGVEKLSAPVLRGKQLFYDARDTRLARDGYLSCASCHADGGQDGRVWDLTAQGEGLRNTISLRGHAGMAQGVLHWSGNFDEVQDFEGQIRGLAGGTGLMADSDYFTGTRSQPLGTPKAGISADLDALAAYVASLSSFAPSPARTQAGALTPDALLGKAVFAARHCIDCHSGPNYTDSSAASVLHDIGTLKPSSGKRLGGGLTGIDTPTLRDLGSTAPYLHDGSAPTLAAAVQAHRGVSLSAVEMDQLVAYLRQIGREEPGSVVNLASYRVATQVSTVGSAVAGLALDGNTNGVLAAGSVTQTAGATAEDWWQVDLGTLRSVQMVQIWGRTDCCAQQLANFYLLVSPVDMSGRSLAQLRADTRITVVPVATLGGSASILLNLGSVSARYVRVQLSARNPLSLAEVRVIGW